MILLSSIIASLVPKGRTGDFIKGITKLITLSVMVSPLVGYLKKGEFSFEGSPVNLSSDYLAACVRRVEEGDEAEIAAFLRENFFVEVEVAVKREIPTYSLKMITINIFYSGINADEGHIDKMNRMRNAVQEKYGCEVIVNEMEAK